jgi:hypothetical protein
LRGGGSDEGDAGDDAVCAAGEKTEHTGSVGGVLGLAEDQVVKSDGGVGAEDDEGVAVEVRGIPGPKIRTWGTHKFVVGGEFVKDGLGFFAGQTGDVGGGIFAGKRIFGDVGRVDLERETGLGEEFAPAWRG